MHITYTYITYVAFFFFSCSYEINRHIDIYYYSFSLFLISASVLFKNEYNMIYEKENLFNRNFFERQRVFLAC